VKVCEHCGVEIDGLDGDNLCRECEESDVEIKPTTKRKGLSRRDRDDLMSSLGLVKVKGACGGVYWE
jgi:hypothetical protein